MLQIWLDSISASEGLAGVQPSPVEAATITCPDHLVLANLPVAKGIHSAKAASLVKTLGHKSHRQLGERVHICVCCDFPIAIYGRLSPCEHAFCLDCARSDSMCYLCYERIQRIQKIKMMKGIFICAAPHCLKSFLKKSELDLHIRDIHADLLWPNTDKDGNESETPSVWQTIVLDSSTRGPQRSVFFPRSNSQPHDRENNGHLQPPTDQPSLRPTLQPKRPFFGQVQNEPSDPQFGSTGGSQQGFHQQSFDMQQTPKEPCQFAYRHQGVAAESPFPDYSPVHSAQPPNIAMPIISNPMLNPPMPLGYPPYSHGGVPPFYVDPYEMFRHDSLLGFSLGAASGHNFPANYPQPLNAGTSGVPFEQAQTDMAMDQMDAKGMSAQQPMPPLPPPPPPPSHMPLPPPPPPPPPRPHMSLPPRPPPPPPHIPHLNQRYYSGEFGHDDHGYGWQNDNHDAFGGQD